MTDIMSFFDSRFLQSFDLADRDGKPKEYTLAIEKVTGGELTTVGGQVSRKPVLHLKGAKKALALNKTNARTVADLYGRDVSRWVGRLVTLYPTTTKFGRDNAVPCIRIRPKIPQLGQGQQVPDREPDKAELERKAAAAASVEGNEHASGT